jgi:hypothetical protein
MNARTKAELVARLKREAETLGEKPRRSITPTGDARNPIAEILDGLEPIRYDRETGEELRGVKP